MPISILKSSLPIWGSNSEIQPTVEKLEKLEIPVEVSLIIRIGVGITTPGSADDGRYRRLVPGTFKDKAAAFFRKFTVCFFKFPDGTGP